MNYFRYMWLEPSLDLRRHEIFEKIRKNGLPEDLYALVLPESGPNALEIYPARILKQKHFKESEQLVVGLAGSYDSALELGAAVTVTVLEKTGKTDVRAYIEGAGKAAEKDTEKGTER